LDDFFWGNIRTSLGLLEEINPKPIGADGKQGFSQVHVLPEMSFPKTPTFAPHRQNIHARWFNAKSQKPNLR
jgi:hypothetical protein